MAAASPNSRPSKPTASTTRTSTASASQDNKTQTLSSNPPVSPSSVTSLPLRATRSSSSNDGPSTTTALAASNPVPQRQQPSNGSPTGSLTGGLFAFAAAALSGISEPRLRPRQSLSRLSIGPDYSIGSGRPSPERPSRHRSTLSSFSPSSTLQGEANKAASATTFSKPYSETDPTRPLPIHISRQEDKMHQTSSRLLRMTDDDRPFTKDFKDLFSTLIVSLLPLSAHRVRLTKVEHTFLSEDAINNLGSLKFSQSNRMPDPKDPSRIVTTTTTTTFSMAKDMARSICQRFLEARFIESADGRYQQLYTMKGSVWQLTPKGVCVLDRFCSRNGIQQKQVAELIGNNICHLVILERDGETDKLITDRATIEVIFRRFVGVAGPNVKSSVSTADSESLSDYRDGLTGVKMAGERKIAGKVYKDTFTGKAATDWLMDCCTTVDRRETFEIASLFVEYDLLESIQQDRSYMTQFQGSHLFQPTKHAVYQLTAKGKDLISGGLSRGRTSESEGASSAPRGGIARDSNTQRLDKILNDAALRLLFRENLRETHCEENLSFYVDVDEFVRGCRRAIRAVQKTSPSNAASMDGIKEIMAQAYGIYNAFLAPGSPCELNIDHQLRNNLATRMTKAVGQDVAMIETLHEVTSLFEDAQNAVFKLMASDSVPKFLRNPKYEQTLQNYDFDATSTQPQGRLPERSQSRSTRSK